MAKIYSESIKAITHIPSWAASEEDYGDKIKTTQAAYKLVPLVYRSIRLRCDAISSVPVIAKLAPQVTDITVIARAAEDAGADAVSLINTFPAMAIDVNKRRSVLGNFTGGLSGPAIRPMAVHMVYQTAQRVKIPIIAMGGIMTADDALQFILAGATMVAVGTANFINPRAPVEVLEGIKDYMRKNKIADVKELIGRLET